MNNSQAYSFPTSISIKLNKGKWLFSFILISFKPNIVLLCQEVANNVKYTLTACMEAQWLMIIFIWT